MALLFFISMKPRSVIDRYELFIDKITRDHLAWTIGNRDSYYKYSPRRSTDESISINSHL